MWRELWCPPQLCPSSWCAAVWFGWVWSWASFPTSGVIGPWIGPDLMNPSILAITTASDMSGLHPSEHSISQVTALGPHVSIGPKMLPLDVTKCFTSKYSELSLWASSLSVFAYLVTSFSLMALNTIFTLQPRSVYVSPRPLLKTLDLCPSSTSCTCPLGV